MFTSSVQLDPGFKSGLLSLPFSPFSWFTDGVTSSVWDFTLGLLLHLSGVFPSLLIWLLGGDTDVSKSLISSHSSRLRVELRDVLQPVFLGRESTFMIIWLPLELCWPVLTGDGDGEVPEGFTPADEKNKWSLLASLFPWERFWQGFARGSGGAFTQADVKNPFNLVVSFFPWELSWQGFADSSGGEGSGGFIQIGVKNVVGLFVSEGAVRCFVDGCSWATFTFLSFSATWWLVWPMLVTTDPSEEFFFLKVNTL